MNRLRGLFGGGDEDPNSSQYPSNNNSSQNSSRYNSNNHGWNSNNNNNNNNSSNSRYNYKSNNPDLYLSDDDSWGMSAISRNAPHQYEDSRYGGMGDGMDGSGRRNSQIFWDQETPSMRSDGGGGGEDVGDSMHGSGRGRGSRHSSDGRSGGGGVMASSSSDQYMQEWEREAMMRDNLDNAFEIGDEDYYHSEQRGPSESSPVGNNPGGYQDGHGEEAHPEHHEEDDDDESKEEVVNAYLDYLKSIREGGFESYLNDEVEDDTPDFEELARPDENAMNGNSSDHVMGNNYSNNVQSSSSAALTPRNGNQSRVMEIEEERRGTFYGDLYGVRDVRASRSPYAMWKSNSRSNTNQYDEERHHHDDASISSWMNYNDSSTRGTRVKNGVAIISHSCANHPKFQRWCTILMVIIALAMGLSVYAGNKDQEVSTPEELSIPPKENGSAGGSSGSGSMSSESPTSQTGKKPKPNNGPPDAIANALKTFDPIWFNRQSGWEGITFADAVNFCASNDQRVPCPYEIYCNRGPDQAPYDGTRPNGEQWAATSNGPNQWVQVGDMFTCQRYTDLHDKKKPEWGITGVSLEHDHGAGGITQNVMCCKDANHLGPVTDWGKQDAIDHAEEDSTSETTDSSTMQIEDEENEKDASTSGGDKAVISDNVNIQKREKAVIAAFQPIWFSSAHGWSGGSYEDGVEFCESYNHMVLCPFAAYCPNGPGHPPLAGSMVVDLDGEEWVPANGPMNTWVQIGKVDGDEDTTCTLYHELLGDRPDWGIDGSRQDLKHHIMCCLM